MFQRFMLLVLFVLILAACGETASTTSTTETTVPPTTESQGAVTDTTSTDLRKVTLALSFTPNVQFAPYYVAAAKGYYAEAGLDVAFDYNFENDVTQRAATWPASQVEFATTSGTSVLLARQQGLPVKTVLTLYQQFPVVFFSKANVALASPQDLKGKSIGIPGRFGESYYALLALLYAENLQESDLNVQEIGFTQAQAVLEDKVQVATGYGMNEPVLLRQQGQEANVLRVADVFPLAANGIAVSEQLIAQEPDLVRGFVQASLRGLQDTLDDPEAAFAISVEQVPEAQLGDPDFQRQVLQESLPYWYSDQTTTEGLGYTDLETWQQTAELMLAAELLTGPMNVEDGFTNEFIK
ncbi:MAG: ABC transporter substrate-binding protein [Chloroflexales bacterium]|nr:ABC transporter substrate-binding protein [Chloroflexales bacterium]